MMLLNGYLYCASNFIQQMENISVYVAADRIDKELLREIIAAHIALEQDNEELKLKIALAIMPQ